MARWGCLDARVGKCLNPKGSTHLDFRLCPKSDCGEPTAAGSLKGTFSATGISARHGSHQADARGFCRFAPDGRQSQPPYPPMSASPLKPSVWRKTRLQLAATRRPTSSGRRWSCSSRTSTRTCLHLAAATAGTIILVARLWDAFFDPADGRSRRPDAHALGQVPPLGSLYRAPLGGHHVPRLPNAETLDDVQHGRLRPRDEHPPHDAVLDEQHAVLGARGRDDRRRERAGEPQLVPVRGRERGAVHRGRVHASSGGEVGSGPEHDRQRGWARGRWGLWAALCLVLFPDRRSSRTRERIHPEPKQKSTPKQDFGDPFRNSPWVAMFLLTLVQFALIAPQGESPLLGHPIPTPTRHLDVRLAPVDSPLTAAPVAAGSPAPGGLLEWLGYIVHADRADLAASNVADVFNSIINMLGKVVIIVVISSRRRSPGVRQEGGCDRRFCLHRRSQISPSTSSLR